MNKKFIELKKTLGKFISNFSVEKTEDGKEIIFDGDEVFEGLEVNTYDADGNIVALEDGEYEIKSVKVKVAKGKVSELLDKEPSKKDEKSDKKSEEKSDEKLNFSSQMADAEKSYSEKERAIAEEIKKISPDAWIVEASDAHAVVEIYNDAEGSRKLLKYAISWNEDGGVSLGESVEVVPAYIPKDGGADKESEALKAENEALKKEIEELKKKPAAAPVPQKTEMSRQGEITDNVKGTKFERACRIFKK